MPYQEFQTNLKNLCDIIDQVPPSEDEKVSSLTQRYIEQNLMILNDIFSTSIENIQRLVKATNPNDIICTQARFSSEISKKVSLSTQRFLNASLGQLVDYNEWLKAHCDFATD